MADGQEVAQAALAAASQVPKNATETEYRLVFSWRGQKLPVTVMHDDTVGDLKGLLFSLTTVPPARQKLVGLVKGALPGDEISVGSLGLDAASVKNAMLIGTEEGKELQPEVGSRAGDLAPISVDVDYACERDRTQTGDQS